MNRDGASPRRRRSVAAALPAALLLSVLLAAPVVSSPLAAPTPTVGRPAAGAQATVGPTVGRPAGSPAEPAAVARPRAAPTGRPRWSVSRGAIGVLVLSYVGIGALAAAGIWSYVRRGRW